VGAPRAVESGSFQRSFLTSSTARAPGPPKPTSSPPWISHLAIWGNDYLAKYRQGGDVVQLGLLHPDRVRPELLPAQPMWPSALPSKPVGRSLSLAGTIPPARLARSPRNDRPVQIPFRRVASQWERSGSRVAAKRFSSNRVRDLPPSQALARTPREYSGRSRCHEGCRMQVLREYERQP
jgi:hypothetical protein